MQYSDLKYGRLDTAVKAIEALTVDDVQGHLSWENVRNLLIDLRAARIKAAIKPPESGD